ncbi:hypothetical protein B0H21DRAFT_693977 [Amylocystis lapponica]|nr:hypothetical protein B0H21DRAFT_693977 [Amylocystis lapponica]
MPLAPVDDQGTQLYFEDSGAPLKSTTYSTLVLVHGAVFNGGIFLPMFRFAAAHNIRLVAVNLRDNAKSTPFSASEIDIIHSGNLASQTALVQARGIEFAVFLEWFIKQNNIPRLSVSLGDTREVISGGVAVLGWSSGNAVLLSFLSHSDKLSNESREFLDGHLRTYIMLDGPGHVFGLSIPPAETAYCPLRDPSVKHEDASSAFALWVSGYHVYSPHILHGLDSFDDDELFVELAKGSGAIDDPPPHQRPTFQRMPEEEITKCTDIPGGMRSHLRLLGMNPVVYSTNLHDALIDPKAWPQLRTVLVWCDMSNCDTVFSATQMMRMLKQSWPATGRKVEVLRMEGANHFPHWDSPESTLQCFASII